MQNITSKIEYQGNFQCVSTHIASNSTLKTVPPIDNNGDGSSFSPTDLCATSLGQCALTTIAILAKNNYPNLDFIGTEVFCTKIMAPNPRRIAEIKIEFKFNRSFTEAEEQWIYSKATTCPVALSLHPDIKQSYTFNFI